MTTSRIFTMRNNVIVLLVLAAALPGSALAQSGTSNLPPSVVIVTPTPGAVFTAPVDVPIVTDARDRDGFVASVEFYANNLSLGSGTNRWNSATSTNLFGLIWSNAPPGQHALTARATDNRGASTTSAPVKITVQPATVPPLSVVTIRAPDPYAAEPCGALTVIDTGMFTVQRSGGTNVDVLVRYSISGTASIGVDYRALSNVVVIPKGAYSADIWVWPCRDSLIEGTETVVLRLEPVACPAIWPPPADCYLVGQPCEAVVFIRDCPPGDLPPLVQLLRPPAGAVFLAPANINLLADTVDPDGYVWKVEFFEGTNKIGEQRKLFIIPPTNGTHIPYDMTWSNVPPGKYVLTARATDSAGTTAVSRPVPIAVVMNAPPPITNLPPVVTIVATDPVAIEGTNCWGWADVTNRWPIGTTNCVTLASTTQSRIWWFTNCGPKNATFTVYRAGDTNGDLAVGYRTGGTATNGVDYDLLPGVVSIPAGARKANILIVPREDQHPDPIKTVILTLVPVPIVSNTLPPYFVGCPNRAAAIIVDSDRPRLTAAALPDKCFLLRVDAAEGAWFRIERSADLVTWLPVCSSYQVIQGAVYFVDPEAQGSGPRFYRAVPEASPVLE